jgi:hypothetical protein
MIFLVWTLKSVKSALGIEYDQRVIIKFLWNKRADAHDIADRLETDCRQIADRLQTDCRQIADRLQTDFRHSLVNMLINIEQFDSGLQRHGSIVKTCIMKFASEDFHLMMLTGKFWLY